MEKSKAPIVIFLGQPNCGKSTLFNSIAGFQAETSNFPGTTVKHTHSLVNIDGHVLNIIDLPGTYSLSPADPAEKVALTHLFREKPDLIINVIDASILGRSLELTLELLEVGYPIIVALNMIDLAEKKGIKTDVAALERFLGVPVVPTIATHGWGIRQLLDAAFSVLKRKKGTTFLPWSQEIEFKIDELSRLLPVDFPVIANRRFTAIKLIEGGKLFVQEVLQRENPSLLKEIEKIRRDLETSRRMPAYEVLAAERHHLAMKIFEESSKVLRGKHLSLERRLDNVLMHPVLGYILLIMIFLAFFFIVFKVGNPLERVLLRPFSALRQSLLSLTGEGVVFSVCDGLLQGIGGGISIVLPYFLPLLFLMAFLEDVGYLARAGFLLDSFMHHIGLHGKSISPFILGFGCNVPAVMATRILESPRDRLVTSLLIPFIPCSARTTIILGLIAFFLGPFWALGIYFFNILLVAMLSRLITLFFREPSPGLIMEIPFLKGPSFLNMFKKTYFQLKSFVRFAWPILVAGSVALSLLQYFHLDRYLNIFLSPLVERALGLPPHLGVTLIFGFLRKELSLLMMVQALGADYQHLLMAITKEQLIVFTVFISLFIPCLSTFAVLWKESGKKVAFLSAGLSISAAILVSLLVRLIY